MSVEVMMPQMGESIAEGTVVRWLKKPGDRVKRDEPLFEISTDKVDTEIPSPGDGILSEIKVKEGQTVPVNTVVALLSDQGEAAGGAAAEKAPGEKAQAPKPAAPAAATAPSPGAAQASRPQPSPARPPQPPAGAQKPRTPESADSSRGPSPPAATGSAASGQSAPGREETIRSSPLVRKIAQEHGVDISQIKGSGAGGRVTKKDILDYISESPAGPETGAGTDAGADTGTGEAPAEVYEVEEVSPVEAPAGEWDQSGVRVEPMSIMRTKIAEHMILSRRTSAHVTTVHEVDLTEVARTREARKEAFFRDTGVKLTFLPFILKAAVDALKEFPVLNASVVGREIHYHRSVKLGIAVALEDGLLVPVIKNAEEKSILGLARAIQDLAERARTKRLTPGEVQGGTFTVSNYGSFGSVIATPIINQPQVAILGVGAAVKRPAVLPGTEAIAIRTTCFLSLSFDHRLIDGATADRYLSRVKESLERGPFHLS